MACNFPKFNSKNENLTYFPDFYHLFHRSFIMHFLSDNF